MATIASADQKLVDLIFFGFDHGIDSIRSGGVLIPFVITEDSDGVRKIERFVTEQIEEGKKKAEEYLQKLNPVPDFAIIAYDGYITIDGTKYDAIIVKGLDKTQEECYMLAQRYTPKALLRSLKTIGNAIFIDSESNILKR